MSKREPPWWRAPLAQWQREVTLELGAARPASRLFAELRNALGINGREGIDLVDATHLVAHTIVDLETLGQLPIVDRLMRQLLGQRGPLVLSAAQKARKNVCPPYRRKLLQPLLGSLAIDTELRPPRRPWKILPPERQTRAALQHEAKQRKIIDELLAEQRQRVCAAGYLLLITVLAFEGAGAVVNDRKVAKAVAAELLHATVWLYGKPSCKPVISLVQAVTGEKLAISSIRWLAQQLPPD
jgi:hypothetical protein